MRQFAGIIVAFAMLLVMLKGWPRVFKGKKAPLGPVLVITGLIMAVIGGRPVSSMADAAVKIVTTSSSLQTLIVVLEIGVLGSLLKQYGLLDKIVRAMSQLVPSKKALIMALPAIMGLLPVPGGAFLSAPFVDELGNDLQLSGERKSVINLYFRHVSMFILPYNTTMLAVLSALPEVNAYHLIGLNLPFVALYLLGAWFCYVRSAPSVKAERSGNRMQALKDVLLYLSPIYLALVLNVVAGLAMYQSLLLCILLVFFLIGKDKSEYLHHVVKGLNFNTLLMLAGVYYLQNTVKGMDAVMGGMGSVMTGQSIWGFVLLVPVIALAFGVSTGVNLVPMSILLPLVANLNLPPVAQTVYAMYVVLWCFFGYYFSPFHLCHLLSIQYMGCDAKPVYRLHLRMMPLLCIAGVALFLGYFLVLL